MGSHSKGKGRETRPARYAAVRREAQDIGASSRAHRSDCGATTAASKGRIPYRKRASCCAIRASRTPIVRDLRSQCSVRNGRDEPIKWPATCDSAGADNKTAGDLALIPAITACLICDLIRPELGGKIAILGYYGHCPNVDVLLQNLDQPAVLTFVCAGAPSRGSMQVRFDLIDMTDERLLVTTGNSRFIAEEERSGTFLAPTLIAQYGRAGPFQLRCFINDALQYSGDFRIQQGPTS